MSDTIHPFRATAGFTLVELVITIVVLAAALAGILVVFQETTARSVDPQLRAQARALAEAHMEEILLQRYCEDPPACTNETGGAEAGESRSSYDDVQDYDEITDQNPPQDRFGDDLGQLGDYSVGVTVSASGGRADVTVRVQHTASTRVDYTLRSERANY